MMTDFYKNNDFQIELSLDNQIQEESKYTYEYVTKENNNFCIYDNLECCEFRITNNTWNIENYIQVGESPRISPKFSPKVSPRAKNKKNEITLNSPNSQNYKKKLRYFDVNIVKKEKESRRFFSDESENKKFNFFLSNGNNNTRGRSINENLFKLNLINFNKDKNIIENLQENINQCFRCKKSSHLTHECPTLKTKKHKCDQCNLNGHFAEDCLKYPKPIPKYILENSICSFCNLKGHLICQTREKIQMVDSEDEVSKQIESSYNGWKDDPMVLSKRQYVDLVNDEEEDKPMEEVDKVSCPKCRGDHLIKYCPILINTNIGWGSTRTDENYFYIGPSALMKNKNFYDEDDFSD